MAARLNISKNNIKIVSKPIRGKHGLYRQVELASGHPATEYDKSLNTDGIVDGWSEADVAKAQVFAANFVLQDVFDSQIVGNRNSKTIAALTKIIDAKSAAKRVSAAIDQKVSPYAHTIYTQEKPEAKSDYPGYKLVENGEPRMVEPTFKLVSSQPWEGGMYFVFSATYGLHTETSDGRQFFEPHQMECGVTVKKQGGKMKVWGLATNVANYAEPQPASTVK